MKINGKKLGWALICLTLFISLIFSDTEIILESLEDVYLLIFYFGIASFFAWGVIKNLEETFI